MREAKAPGEIIIFAGPHGSGKDTIEAAFTASQLGAIRHVRFSSRPQATGEVEGQTYHFVSQEEFDTLAAGGFFLDHVRNPASCGGVSRDGLANDLQVNRFTSLTMNLKEGLSLYNKLTSEQMARRVLLLCIGPCAEDTMIYNPDMYLGILARRMLRRGRIGAGQGLVGRLKVAEEYRRLYIKNQDRITHIANEDNKQSGGGVTSYTGSHGRCVRLTGLRIRQVRRCH